MNTKKIEERIIERGYRLSLAWIATEEDRPYFPSCRLGDLIVEIAAYDLSSVAWMENWGDPKEWGIDE